MTDVRCLIKYSPETIEVTNNLRRRLDIWRKATDGIGRFKVELLGDWAGDFLADDPIQIRFDDLIVFEGYLDKGLPIAEGDVYRQNYEIVGRDYGQDLMNKEVNKTGEWMYKTQYADLIIADMLTKASSEITFTPSGDHKYGTAETIPEISYTDLGDEALIEAFRKIFEQIDYDFYVDENKVLIIFPIGSINSGIILVNVPDSPNNNLLGPLKKTEFDSYDLINYVVAKVKKNDDGWSDGNAADFVKEAYNIVTNDFIDKVKGTSAIKCVKGAGADLKLGLEFPKYNYPYLPFDLVQEDTVRFGLKLISEYSGPDRITNRGYPKLILEDTEGHQIAYRFYDEYAGLTEGVWRQITVPMGNAVNIVDFKQMGYGIIKWHNDATFEWQCYTEFDPDLFNWRIAGVYWVIDSGKYPNEYIASMSLDNVTIPFPMVSYKQDGGSEGSYKVRKRSFTPNNIRTQAELESFAQAKVDKMKDPLYALSAVAVGTAGIIGGVFKWIPGFMVTVNSPGEGINYEEYRISEAHYIILEESQQGHNFIVEAELVPKELSISGSRLGQVKDPDIALLRELSDRISYFEKSEDIHRDYLPPMPADAASKIKVGDFSNLADTAVAWTRHYEAENSSYDAEWVEVDDAMASKGKALKLASAALNKEILFLDGPLGVIGELYFLVRLKVSDKTKAANLIVNVYDKDGEEMLGTATFSPANFPANNKYHHLAIRAEVPADQQNIQFMLRVSKSDDFDLYCDYGGIVPADLPLGYADVTLSEHLGTDVSGHAGTDTDAHGGTDTDSHNGSSAAGSPGSSVVANVAASGTSTPVNDSTWTTLVSLNVPDVNHEALFIFASAMIVTAPGINYSICGRIYDETADVYYPIDSSTSVQETYYMPDLASISAIFFFALPKNLKNHTLKFQIKHGIGSTKSFFGRVTYWGHAPHTHTMTNPSDHTITQPSDHVVTNPEDHTVIQPEDHTTESIAHEH